MRAHKEPIAIILLAAGQSTRFGRPKQLVQFKGRSLLRYLAEISVASKAESVHVVLGAFADLLKLQLLGLPVHIIRNQRWNEGLSFSLTAALTQIGKSVRAVLILLCDQPHVTTELLDKLIDRYSAADRPIVACEYRNILGVPTLFDRRFFSELMSLTGDKGAKQVILRHRNVVASIPFPQGVIDIDTIQDAKNLNI